MGLSEGHVNPESLTQLLGKGHSVSRDRRTSACPGGLVHFVTAHELISNWTDMGRRI